MPHKTKRKDTTFQVIQFSAIGGVNALIDIGTLNLLLLMWPTTDNQLLTLYNTIAYTLAVTNSYLFNSNLTFRKRASKNKKEMVFFCLQAIASLVISNVVLLGGIALLDLISIPMFIQQNIAKGAAMFLSSTASYFFMRYFVFRKKEGRKEISN
ncbi:GtrA family protein [Oceanobacillus massiliensis]|uniref:GtrA family protein n=1 Tax=Oceanobacillus massiliensis TaxID=1465765 RepID=UPI0002899B7A|nr:GtrA family protein [Oceanobacillus massiliensis]